jgi:lysylphosphatidylglycerol synthetase-like protein (DUF2156 family)
MAAVARGFSDYLATLIGADPTSPPFEFAVSQDKGHGFDIVAAVIIMVMSVLLSLGVRESAWFISGDTLLLPLLLLMTRHPFVKPAGCHQSEALPPAFAQFACCGVPLPLLLGICLDSRVPALQVSLLSSWCCF